MWAKEEIKDHHIKSFKDLIWGSLEAEAEAANAAGETPRGTISGAAVEPSEERSPPRLSERSPSIMPSERSPSFVNDPELGTTAEEAPEQEAPEQAPVHEELSLHHVTPKGEDDAKLPFAENEDAPHVAVDVEAVEAVDAAADPYEAGTSYAPTEVDEQPAEVRPASQSVDVPRCSSSSFVSEEGDAQPAEVSEHGNLHRL